MGDERITMFEFRFLGSVLKSQAALFLDLRNMGGFTTSCGVVN